MVPNKEGVILAVCGERGEMKGLTPRSELASLFAENEIFMAEQRVRKHYPKADLEKIPVGSVLIFPKD